MRPVATSATKTYRSPTAPSGSRSKILIGRCFVHPLFDYLIIGGGLSLLLIGGLLVLGWNNAPRMDRSLPALYLLFNSAHFAASTLRLYSKKGSFEKLPFLTMGFPLVAMVVLLFALKWPGSIGYYINKLYLTWSPFHYAATAYGLTLIYCYRSGREISVSEKRLLRWTSLLPFFYALSLQELNGYEGWFTRPDLLASHPQIQLLLNRSVQLTAVLSVAFLIILMARPFLRGKQTLPLIVPLLLVSNGIWWIVFTRYTNAFNMATVFHGMQYLAIVCVFHVRERLSEPENARGALYHAAVFYLGCLVFAIALFQFWPYAFALAGFGRTESVLLVIAVINIHHFIVDAYIWKLKSDPNYQNIVAPGTFAPAKIR